MEQGHKIEVLDHGYVKLVDHMGTDEGIIEAARMSTGRGFEGWEDREECQICGTNPEEYKGVCSNDGEHSYKKKAGDKNLLNFMYRNKHMTPFEMCELQIEVYAPIMVFREWMRSRTQSYNEFSARYSVMPNEHYVPELARFAAKKSDNKQEASIGIGEHVDPESLRNLVDDEQEAIYKNYEMLLERGVPKEIARVNTPVSRYSKMRAKTDLRNWIGFLNLRMRPNAQLEIRLYANAVSEVIKSLWPRTYALFEEYDLYGAHFSRTELRVVHELMGTVGIGDGSLTRGILAAGGSASLAKELVSKIDNGGSKIL